MDIERVARISDNCHTHILESALPGPELSFADSGRLSVVRSYLHKVEWHIRLFPFLTPTVYHIGEYLLVFIGTDRV